MNHDFGFKWTTKSIKGSKDADHNLVSKKDWAKKMAHCVGSQGQVKLAKKLQKHASIMMSHTENPKPTINLFQSELLSESVDVLNSSLTQSAGELQRCKGFQKGGADGLLSPFHKVEFSMACCKQRPGHYTVRPHWSGLLCFVMSVRRVIQIIGIRPVGVGRSKFFCVPQFCCVHKIF